MKIKRIIDGKEVEIALTKDEIGQAYGAHIKTWMADRALAEDLRLTEEDAKTVAEMAFEEYLHGDGLTEEEALLKGLEEFWKMIQETKNKDNSEQILDNIRTVLFGSLFAVGNDKSGLQYVGGTGEKNSFVVKDISGSEYRICVTKEIE